MLWHVSTDTTKTKTKMQNLKSKNKYLNSDHSNHHRPFSGIASQLFKKEIPARLVGLTWPIWMHAKHIAMPQHDQLKTNSSVLSLECLNPQNSASQLLAYQPNFLSTIYQIRSYLNLHHFNGRNWFGRSVRVGQSRSLSFCRIWYQGLRNITESPSVGWKLRYAPCYSHHSASQY